MNPLDKVRQEPVGYRFLYHVEIEKVAVVVVPPKSSAGVNRTFAPVEP